MTLHLRLTLFATLLVGLVLVLTALLLHWLFSASLQRNLDSNLEESLNVVLATLETEGDDGYEYEDSLELHLEGNGFPLGQSFLILNNDSNNGEVLASYGTKIADVNALIADASLGFSSVDGRRILKRDIGRFYAVILRTTDDLQSTLRTFDGLLFVMIPLSTAIAFVLAYILVRSALSPVDRLTKAAYRLAQRRAWQESLPEPRSKDELWRLASATNSLLASLRQVIESERRFTADAAHELRTPLTILQGRLEQALEHNHDASNEHRLLKARGATQKLLHLVETLLLLARTEAGQGLHKETLALDELAFDCAEELRPLFDERKVALSLQIPSQAVMVEGDRMSLHVLIRNLLENALKFAGARVWLELKQHPEPPEHIITLCIRDDGEGIPEGVAEKLFERFYQSQISHRKKGSGLGLALVKSIADWHGAKVTAGNHAEGGAVFCYECPSECFEEHR